MKGRDAEEYGALLQNNCDRLDLDRHQDWFKCNQLTLRHAFLKHETLDLIDRSQKDVHPYYK